MRIIFTLVVSAFLVSCSSSQAQYTKQSYIDTFKDVAIKEMHRTGIPASIKMAQACLESANGNSYLARNAKNHFGIKCGGGYSGPKVYRDDDKKNDCFRKYRTDLESFMDHSDFLQKSRYAFLFEYETTDYKSWAYGLKKAGYATDPNYPKLLIKIIEDNQLYLLDTQNKRQRRDKDDDEEEENVEEVEVKTNVREPKKVKIDKTDVPETAPAESATTGNPQYHQVKAGESLYSISKKYGISVDELKKWNRRTHDTIYVGQSLKVKP